ncbi:hypothetical protein M422DRAFT_776328 [Sphaerobolus stellatus SS14]|nr:hypothetical protein M422DRAFT_776328 [Sphaerobolus stellatus SS14]
MSQVLCISEILDLIFSFSTPGTQAASSQVCKTWLEPALNQLWKTIDDPYALFVLLAPLKLREDTVDRDFYHYPSEDPALEFSRGIRDSDWLRFDYYAPRIRRISLFVEEDEPLHDSVWAEVARTRSRMVLLPNLQEICWYTYPWKYAILFMHPGIRKVSMDFLQSNPELGMATDAIADVASRCPGVTDLSFKNIDVSYRGNNDLLKNITSFQHLKSVKLSAWLCKAELALELSKLPSLEKLYWHYDAGYTHGRLRSWDMTAFCQSLPQKAFPSLRELDLRINLDAAATIISHPHFSAQLSRIEISIVNRITNPHQITSFLEACAKFPALTAIYLNLYPSKRSTRCEDFKITNEMLQPVMACPNLTCFCLESPNASAVTQDKLEDIARTLRHLVTFTLCRCPPYETPSPLSLSSIIPFFRFCPNISLIGLYIDGNVPVELPEDISFTQSKGYTLDVGTSPLSEGESARRVAAFLSQLQTRSGIPITVKSGLVWESGDLRDEDPYEASKKAWGGVFEQLKSLRVVGTH